MRHTLKVLLIGATLASVLMSCSAPISVNKPIDKPWVSYSVGEVRKASTGSTMVSGLDGARYLPGFLLVGALQVESIGQQPPRTSGAWSAQYLYDGPCKGGRYLITNPRFYANRIGIIVAEDGTITCEEPVMRCCGMRAGNTWRVVDGVGTRPFVPEPFPAEAGGVKWELVYSGRSGNEIGLTYREYTNGAEGTMARPAFFQDLKYDISASTQVVFRSVELEILEATNTGITFRVTRDAQRLP